MSEQDSDLPDPLELFRQMQRQSGASNEEDGADLPDPGELFAQMERSRQAQLREDEELPDSMELFERMRRSSEAPDDQETSDSADVFEEMRRRAKADAAGYNEVRDDLHLPLPQDDLPHIPSPDEKPLQIDEPGPTGGLLGRLKARFEKSQPAKPEPKPTIQPTRAPKPARKSEKKKLPTPEELFRQMKAEREEAALNFEEGSSLPAAESNLPTPEELFRRMKEEYAEQGREVNELPALPDLDALKAEMEAEERARLDPDLESELAGPERFVETVSDHMFSSTSFVESLPQVPESEPEPEAAPRVEKQLPRPTPQPLPPPEPMWKDEPEVASEEVPEREGASPTGTVRVEDAVSLGPTAVSPVKPTYSPATRSAGRGVTPTSYAHASAQQADKSVKKKFKRFSRQKLSIFTRQMSVMLRSGIQLHMAISFASDSDPELSPILTEVMRKVESGYTFSAALADTSRTFDHIYVGLVQSGEMSGRLHEILERLADVLEREVDMRKRIISVITYPAVLLLVCFIGTLGFIFFVLPMLIPLFSELSVDLPLPTKILLASREYMLPFLALVTVSVVSFFLARDRIGDYIRSKPSLERRLATIPFYIPVFGDVYDKLITARVLYSLSSMLDVGITLNQALARSEVTAGNALVSYRLSRARLDLADGMGVTDCFRFNQLFSESALHLISAGEESARLAEMFSFVARIFDEDVEYALQSAAAVAEPAIMIVMGVIVGFITISAALPTIQLLQNFT